MTKCLGMRVKKTRSARQRVYVVGDLLMFLCPVLATEYLVIEQTIAY